MGTHRLRTAARSVLRESSNGFLHAAGWFSRRFYLRFIRPRFAPAVDATPPDPGRPITVVLPAADKDADALERCLPSVRQFVTDVLADIWIVAPESARLRALAAAARATFVPEDRILPRPARALKTRGWVLQQMIKLNACHHVLTADYLVLDADTIFLRPQRFVRGGRSLLRYSDQYELLYNRSLELVFGHRRRFPVSFVTHHQLFSAAAVKELLALMEQRFGRSWWEAILHEVDRGHPISFSEYELYGHYVISQPQWRGKVQLEHWGGLDLSAGDLPRLSEIQASVSPRIHSLSFHHHTQ